MNSALDNQRQSLKRGDTDAWRKLVRELSPGMYRYALSLLADPGDAQDAVQKAFVRLHGMRAELADDGSLKTLAFRILTNLSRDARRDRQLRRKREAEAAEFAMLNQARSGPDLEASRAAFAAAEDLPEELREVTMLRFAHGFTAAEAATALGIPEGTVKTRQRTALERLRDVLTRGGFASTPALIDLEGSLHQGAAQITVPETVLLTLETAIMASIGTKTAVGSAVLVLLLILLLTGSFGFVGWMMLDGDPPANTTEQGPLARSLDGDAGRRDQRQPTPQNRPLSDERSEDAGDPSTPSNDQAPPVNNNPEAVDTAHEAVDTPSEGTVIFYIRGKVIDSGGAPIQGAAIHTGLPSTYNPVRSQHREYWNGVGSPEDYESRFSGMPTVTSSSTQPESPFVRPPAAEVSDESGKFSIRCEVRAGARNPYTSLWATKAGYAEKLSGSLISEPAREVTLQLEKLGRHIVFGTEPRTAESLNIELILRGRNSRDFMSHGTSIDSDGRHYIALHGETKWRELRVRHRTLGQAEANLPAELEGRVDLGTLNFQAGRLVQGTVVTPEGKPIAGAVVRLHDAEDLFALTDAAGGFSFSALPHKAVSVVARAGGRAAASATFAAGAEPLTNLKLVLATGVSITGSVRDASGATLTEGVDIFMIYGNADHKGLAQPWIEGHKLARDGTFTFKNIAQGEYKLVARRGLELKVQEVSVLNHDFTLVVDFAAGGRISGIITGPDGQPLAEAEVALMGGHMRPIASTRTAADGSYSFADLAPGVYFVLLESHDLPSDTLLLAKRRLVVEGAQALTLDIDYAGAEAGGIYRGRVVSTGTQPFDTVMLMRTNGDAAMFRGVVLGDGAFRVTGVTPGDYYAWFVAERGTAVHRESISFKGWSEVVEKTLHVDPVRLTVAVTGEGLEQDKISLSVLPVLDDVFGPDPLLPFLEPKRLRQSEAGVKVHDNMPRGRYEVVARHPGRETVIRVVEVQSTTELTIELANEAPDVEVLVKGITDAQIKTAEAVMTKSMVAAIVFKAGFSSPVATDWTRMQPEVSLTLMGLAAGAYRVLLAGPLLVPTWHEIQVGADQPQLELTARPGATVNLDIQMPAGESAAGAAILVFNAAGEAYRPFGRPSPLMMGVMAASGAPEVGPLPAGVWRIEVHLPGREPVSGTVNVRAGESTSLQLQVE